MAERHPVILVVDDEETIVEALQYNLAKEGYAVHGAGDGETALEIARREKPDLIILDLMLPGLSGLDVCRILRREMTSPILMLTARDDEIDKVVGLEVGADDYVTKPFSMRELMARVRAMLRRSQMGAPASTGSAEGLAPALGCLVAGDLTIDLGRREVLLGERNLKLKPKEFELLAFLVRNRGQVLSRELILQRVWGYDFFGDTRTVDVHIRWLREKIETDPSRPVRIATVRPVGYRFQD
jgi:DNA-binding response OmpR family regulator